MDLKGANMKKYYLNCRLFSFFCINLLLLFPFNSNAKNTDTPYKFPIKPGTPQWAEFESHQDMIKACRIPNTILKEMTTKALIMTCINYPLFGDIFAYHDYQMGFKNMASAFNGLQELLKRKDLVPEVIQVYDNMDDLGPESNNVDNKWRFMYMEMLLAQKQVIDNLDDHQWKKLLRESKTKFSSRISKSYSRFKLTPSCLIMGRIAKKKGMSMKKITKLLDQKTNNFLNKPTIADNSIINRIVTSAEHLLLY